MHNQKQQFDEWQITASPQNHILTNINVWSPDSKWLVYDTRSDAAGSLFDGTKIERVNVYTKSIETVYESKNQACVGVATVNQKDGRIAFIQGPEFPTQDWQYSACHRQGMVAEKKNDQFAVSPLDARDIIPPFTKGALRGGSHVHTWDSKGQLISFTYEDHLLTHNTGKKSEPNRRTVGLAIPDQKITVPKNHERNHDGEYACVVAVKTLPELNRAFEDAWLPGRKALTFIGEVTAKDRRNVNELFWLEIPDKIVLPECSDVGVMPKVPEGFQQTRLTFFADQPGHQGLTTTPRHWPRATVNQTAEFYIAFLTEQGWLNFLIVKADQLKTPQLIKTDIQLSSAFSWHGENLFAIVENQVCMINFHTLKITPLSEKSAMIRPEACVVSPNGDFVAFVKNISNINQIFICKVLE